MNPAFLEAFFNAEHKVLGKRLKPYCFAHLLSFAAAEHPLYLKGGFEPNWADLFIAVDICSKRGTGLVKRCGLLGVIWNYARAFYTKVRYDLQTESEKFHQYIKDFDARPLYWTDGEGAGGSARVPWVYSHVCLIEDHSNMTEQEILNAPLGLMLWKSATLGELLKTSEESNLMTEDEAKGMQELGLNP